MAYLLSKMLLYIYSRYVAQELLADYGNRYIVVCKQLKSGGRKYTWSFFVQRWGPFINYRNRGKPEKTTQFTISRYILEKNNDGYYLI